jgi:hypothetical protein
MDTVAAWLEEARAETVRRIVERTRAELSDYRERDVADLSRAVGAAYDGWRRAVLTNDFDRHVAHARRVTRENLARNIHPAQIARTPWLVYEVALALLDEAEGRVNRMERAAFVGRAHHMTVRLTMAVNEEISAGLSAGLSRQPLPSLPPPAAAPEPETRSGRWA